MIYNEGKEDPFIAKALLADLEPQFHPRKPLLRTFTRTVAISPPLI